MEKDRGVIIVGYSAADIHAAQKALSSHGITILEAGQRIKEACEKCNEALSDLKLSFEKLEKPLPKAKSKYHN